MTHLEIMGFKLMGGLATAMVIIAATLPPEKPQHHSVKAHIAPTKPVILVGEKDNPDEVRKARALLSLYDDKHMDTLAQVFEQTYPQICGKLEGSKCHD